MKQGFTWKFLIIFIVLLLAIWQISYTIKFMGLTEQQKAKMDPVKLSRLENRAIHLGLDLSGGMHIILEVDKSKLRPEDAKGATDRALEVIRNRIDQYGVSEPTIQKQGSDRILVELPGVVDKNRARELIGKTALLEFKLVVNSTKTQEIIKKIDEALSKSELAKLDSAYAENMFSSIAIYNGYSIKVLKSDVPLVEQLLKRDDVKSAIPSDVQFLWGANPKSSDTQERDLYLVYKKTLLTGAAIVDARAGIGTSNNPMGVKVDITMTRKAAGKWAAITGANIGENIAIVLDNIVQSAPRVMSRIPNGRSEIEMGSSTMDDAKALAVILKAGALPAPVKIIEERVVGPTMGLDSIRQGVNAILIGGLLVLLFMAVYYNLSGLVADFALVFNVLILLATLSLFRATLTLPGLAGIVLTIGTAVDANVLIFERIREEIRAGKTYRTAIDSGYEKAFTTILDANATTLLAAIILYWFGSGEVKGFAVTLSIGIVVSFFTAIFVTRVFFDWAVTKFNIKKIKI